MKRFGTFPMQCNAAVLIAAVTLCFICTSSHSTQRRIDPGRSALARWALPCYIQLRCRLSGERLKSWGTHVNNQSFQKGSMWSRGLAPCREAVMSSQWGKQFALLLTQVSWYRKKISVCFLSLRYHLGKWIKNENTPILIEYEKEFWPF